MTTLLPTDLAARPVSDISGCTSIGSSNQSTRHVINTILSGLAPLHDPVKRGSDIVRQRKLDMGMNVYKVERPRSCCSQDTEIVALREQGIESTQSIRGRM